MWTEIDEVAAEVEMSEFLCSFIAMLKPELVVETGTYKGYTSRYIARQALLDGFDFVTCDTVVPELGISWGWAFRECSSLNLPELREADFVFSDSDQNLRAKEYELVKPGCVFVVHDTHRTYSHLHTDPLWLGKWVKEQGGVIFPAGRGFGILVKEKH
jgi:hypothetical protein